MNNPDSGSPQAVPPSLVSRGQSGTCKQWTRKQKRHYSTIMSWIRQAEGRGLQLFRVDLTTAAGGRADLLTAHHKELLKRVKRRFGYTIEFVKIQTNEGNGVLHLIWAIDQRGAAYIPQSWLSQEWVKIHGAYRVWIQRVKGQNSRGKISRYLVSQYLATEQPADSRLSYSWWMLKFPIRKTFCDLKRELLGGFNASALSFKINYRPPILTWKQFLSVWDDFLLCGWCEVGRYRYAIVNRVVEKTPL